MGIDNILGEMESDAKGQFYLDGIADEYFDLKGQVKVYHDCDDELMVRYTRIVDFFYFLHKFIASDYFSSLANADGCQKFLPVILILQASKTQKS